MLDNIAHSALSHYNGSFPTVEFFAHMTSDLYKVTDEAGKKYALKIFNSTVCNEIDNQIEILILEAADKAGIVNVPQLVSNKEGKSLTFCTDTLTNATHRVVLMNWLEGVDFSGHESEALFIRLGEMVAQLHEVLKQMTIPENSPPKKWDRVFYFRDESVVYHEEKYSSKVNTEFKALMDEAIPILNKELKRIYNAGELHILHGDLNPWNIMLHEEQLNIIDFEDSILGHPLHELAVLLYYYRENEKFEYESVKKWVLQGYRNVSDIDTPKETDLEVLYMARTTMFLNYVLTLEEDHAEFIERGIGRLRNFLSK